MNVCSTFQKSCTHRTSISITKNREIKNKRILERKTLKRKQCEIREWSVEQTSKLVGDQMRNDG